jgi:hypothetical protein
MHIAERLINIYLLPEQSLLRQWINVVVNLRNHSDSQFLV